MKNMIPVSSSYNLQGMSTLNFNNILGSTNQTQTTLPISALGNILQLHCNPSLTLQVNGPSSLIPVSTKDTNNQEHMNTFRSIYPNQSSYQNIPQQDQCTNTSPRGFNTLIQELLTTYQSQQDSLSQVTIKYNFLLNAMERLLFDVQNNVEYSLLALGISQTISKVKLNQLNQLSQLNCASLISNGVVPMISPTQIFSNCSQTVSNQKPDPVPNSSIIDLTHQRIQSDPTNMVATDRRSETSHSESNVSSTTSPSKPMKMTSLDKLDKLIDETVKKSSGKLSIADSDNTSLNSKSAVPAQEDSQIPNTIDINANMGNAIHHIIRQFYQNASSSLTNRNNGLMGTNPVDPTFPNSQQPVNRLPTDNLKSATNNFSQQVTEIFANSQHQFNTSRNNPSFILCNNLSGNSLINGQNREPFVVSMTNPCKDVTAPISSDTFTEANNTTEDTESTSNREEDDLGFAELDPTEVATRIRDILSLHSIGQRLFAKHVLNLSQGTVSELLSKPKPWSKLSEKGRDSYRKMNQWAQDSSKVQELKSIAPRKGFSGHYAGMSPATPIKEDHETQEKIKRILNDAKMAMASTNSQSNIDEEIFSCYAKPNEPSVTNPSTDNAQLTTIVCNSIQESTPNPTTNVLEFDLSQLQKKITAALQSSSMSNSVRHESLSQMSAAVTYQQSPLIVMNLANIVPCSSSLVVPSVQQVHPSILPVASTKSGTTNIVDKYQHDNTYDFNQTQSATNTDDVKVKTEVVCYRDADKPSEKSPENCSDTKGSVDQFEELKNNNSKSITDLESLENFLKSFIGSIKLTENCFQNEEINTAELVNVIKDHLTKNSISQRTFGCLLGLSQGTVSDILSRPKPWSMLTNKGREPYIRMLKYLLKPTYVKENEKGSTENITNQLSLIESLPNSSSSPSSSDPALIYDHYLMYDDKNEYNGHRISDQHDNDECNMSSSTEGRDYQSWDEDASNQPIDVCGSPIVSLDQLCTDSVKYDDPKERIFNIATRIVTLDTVGLANSVKETLNTHNLGQRIFGEVILKLSQASVSELLSKPKAWSQLSLKGREPYVRMHLWLQSPDRLQILYKSNETKKGEISVKEVDNVDATLAINKDIKVTNNRKISTKRTRVIFTDAQKSELKSVFDKCPYPKLDQLNDLSKRLNLTIATVGNWFHNQRIRIRSKPDPTHHPVPAKIESLSGESEINSEKSLPMNIDDIFDASDDSDNSISAPHLYPEANLQDYGSGDNGDHCYQEKVDDEDGHYFNDTQPCASVAGSNKRKRTNPIKLEMVVNKAANKEAEETYPTNSESESSQTQNLFAVKIQKLDQSMM